MNGSRRGPLSTRTTSAPERGEDRRELTADRAAADDDEAAQRVVEERGGVGVEDVGVVERDARRAERSRAGGDDDHLGLEHAASPPSGALDDDGAVGAERRRAVDHVDAVARAGWRPALSVIDADDVVGAPTEPLDRRRGSRSRPTS